MRYSTAVLTLVGSVAGLAAGAVGYDLATSPLPPVPTGEQPASVSRTLTEDPVAARAKLAPCEPPARLRRGVCVTHVWRTEVVYDAPPAPAALPAQRGPAAPVVARHSDDAVGDDEREDSVRSDDDGREDDWEDDGDEAEDAWEDDGDEVEHEDHDGAEDDGGRYEAD